MTRALILVLSTTLLPLPAHAQPWRDAFEAGDYRRAAARLHSIVVQSMVRGATDVDPAPARALAAIYEHGWGVERDPVRACAVAHMSLIAAEQSPPRPYERYEAQLNEGHAVVDHHCGGLSREDYVTALETIACPRFGLAPQVLTVGPFVVDIGRRGIGLVDGVPALSAGCPVAVEALRALEVEAPPDALPGVGPRYFVELLDWHWGAPDTSQVTGFELRWTLFEIAAAGVQPVTGEATGWSPRWPEPLGSAAWQPALSMQMIRTGHVRWRIDGVPPLRGWVMRPESQEGRR